MCKLAGYVKTIGMREAVTFDGDRNVANFEGKTPKRWTSQMAVGKVHCSLHAGLD